MPKNPKLNIARYKVDGGELNEYEFHKNQQAFVQQQNEPEPLIPGTPPEQKAQSAGALGESIASVMTPAPSKSRKAAKKSGKKTTAKKAAKKSSKKAVPAKAARASKGRSSRGTTRSTTKRATKSNKKAAKKSGTRTKARKK